LAEITFNINKTIFYFLVFFISFFQTSPGTLLPDLVYNHIPVVSPESLGDSSDLDIKSYSVIECWCTVYSHTENNTLPEVLPVDLEENLVNQCNL
jgi:hypothetical protein